MELKRLGESTVQERRRQVATQRDPLQLPAAWITAGKVAPVCSAGGRGVLRCGRTARARVSEGARLEAQVL